MLILLLVDLTSFGEAAEVKTLIYSTKGLEFDTFDLQTMQTHLFDKGTYENTDIF